MDSVLIWKKVRKKGFNWSEVIHYLKNKVGVVDFANAQGLVLIDLRALGLQNFTNPRAFVKSTTPTLFLR